MWPLSIGVIRQGFVEILAETSSKKLERLTIIFGGLLKTDWTALEWFGAAMWNVLKIKGQYCASRVQRLCLPVCFPPRDICVVSRTTHARLVLPWLHGLVLLFWLATKWLSSLWWFQYWMDGLSAFLTLKRWSTNVYFFFQPEMQVSCKN